MYWQKFKGLWQFVKGLFSTWENFEPYFCKLCRYWTNFHCFKWIYRKGNWNVWSHCQPLDCGKVSRKIVTPNILTETSYNLFLHSHQHLFLSVDLFRTEFICLYVRLCFRWSSMTRCCNKKLPKFSKSRPQKVSTKVFTKK